MQAAVPCIRSQCKNGSRIPAEPDTFKVIALLKFLFHRETRNYFGPEPREVTESLSLIIQGCIPNKHNQCCMSALCHSNTGYHQPCKSMIEDSKF